MPSLNRLGRMTEPRSRCRALRSTAHRRGAKSAARRSPGARIRKTRSARWRTRRPPERVLSSCFSSAVHSVPAQSTAAPASPVVPVASRFSRRRRTNPKVITLLNCPLPLPDVVVVPAACAPPRPERAGHRVPASVPAAAPVKISPLYRRRNVVNRDLSFPDLGAPVAHADAHQRLPVELVLTTWRFCPGLFACRRSERGYYWTQVEHPLLARHLVRDEPRARATLFACSGAGGLDSEYTQSDSENTMMRSASPHPPRRALRRADIIHHHRHSYLPL
jgi:hypothetical protein